MSAGEILLGGHLPNLSDFDLAVELLDRDEESFELGVGGACR
jgi:hypothetical protein